ncbi:MAG: hypothetical protein KDI46_08155 [Alphaproteobacteria bacterium]|nr:hypothetical protein [Alphaproteobacteria bacterium]
MTSYIVRLGFLAVFLMIFSSPVLAEDGFGARFGSESAAALDDPSPEALAAALALPVPEFLKPYMNDPALDLQRIEPAAGEDEIIDDSGVSDGASEEPARPSANDVRIHVPDTESIEEGDEGISSGIDL